jgi:tight adherence protein B
MPVAISLMLGFGLLLVLLSVTDRQPRLRQRRRRTSTWASELLSAAGVTTVSATAFVSLCALAGFLAGLVVLAVSHTPPIAVTFAVIAAYSPVAVLRGRARMRRREFAELWPEAVDNLASAVRAGLSLPESLAQLGDRGPEPLRPWFRDFGIDYLATGRFNDCLDRLKTTMADPVGDRVVEALRIARDVGGGDLGRVLRSLSQFLREDARTRSELESRQAWVVNGARLAVASPWIVLLALSFQPRVISRYYSTGGVIVLAIGAAVCLVAYRLMVRLGRLPEERRVLT